MSISQLLSQYGYLAVFLGSLLEGETIVVLAGFAAHQGHLSLPVTLLCAFAGGTLGDQAAFVVGYFWGPSILDRIPGARQRVGRLQELLHRFDGLLIIGVRFMYGLRLVGPIAMGASGVKPIRFAAYNLVGAAIWACLIGGLGYAFGHAMEAVMGNLQEYEEIALGGIVAVAVLFAVVRWVRRRASGDRGAGQQTD